MVTATDGDTLRDLSHKHLWMHNRDWVQMAEEGDPLIIVEGQGIRVTDSEGKSWVDVNGGYFSVNVGYGRTEIAEAAYEQMLKTNYFPVRTTTPPTVMLAEKLAELAPGSLNRSFPVSGGSEANEVAIKMVRAYHRRRGEPGRYKIISRKGSYHGTTGGVQWLGGGGGSREDYEPVYPGMVYAPQPNPYRCEMGGKSPSECAVRCAKAIEDLILFHDPGSVAAVIGESIATPPGAAVPGDEYWPMVREICDKYGVVLVDDEVICGFGRTGKMFGIEHWDVVPDIMTVSKGLVSSYLPLGATIVKKELADHFAGPDKLFRHTFTFAGHPVPAAAALKNIEIIEDEKLVENAADVGPYMKDALEGLMVDHPLVGDVRGIGLLLGVELTSDRKTKAKLDKEQKIPERLTAKFRKNGLILRFSNEIIHIAPPLIVTRSGVDEIVHAMDVSLWELEGELGISKMA